MDAKPEQQASATSQSNKPELHRDKPQLPLLLYQNPWRCHYRPELLIIAIPVFGIFVTGSANRTCGKPLLNLCGVVLRHAMRHFHQIKAWIYLNDYTPCKVFCKFSPFKHTGLCIYFFAIRVFRCGYCRGIVIYRAFRFIQSLSLIARY